ncbi:MAG: hypothetical protein ACLUKK_08555 [Lacrimispora saccharolytica]
MPVSCKRSITKKEKEAKVYPRKGFITPSVPFAERWFIDMEDKKNKEAYIRITAGILFLLMVCCWVFKAEAYFAVIAALTIVCNIGVICLQIKGGRERTNYTLMERIPYILSAILLIVYVTAL